MSVEWTLDGSPQTPVSYPAGFMFTELPSVTDPVDLSGTEGDTVQFEAIADGCPAPAALTWEFSRDDGATWEPVTADPTADETATGLMLNGITLAHDDRQYRAIATNSVGSVHSASATLTVARASTGGVESPATGDSAPPKTEIAKTGGSDSSAALAVGLVLLLAGGLSVLWIRARRRHIAE
ncbi:LPXTG cell wall anchor domain-containing protein [Microbacterium sp. A204]|uniref:LPXTG cell wall anchor domain-containing protein n=1 Tax=Microbacterium sp. A204 TaxID=3457321 RepID=UPI003FD3D0B1